MNIPKSGSELLPGHHFFFENILKLLKLLTFSQTNEEVILVIKFIVIASLFLVGLPVHAKEQVCPVEVTRKGLFVSDECEKGDILKIYGFNIKNIQSSTNQVAAVCEADSIPSIITAQTVNVMCIYRGKNHVLEIRGKGSN